MTGDSLWCSVLLPLSYGQVTPLLLTISTHSYLLSGVKKDNRILDKSYGPLREKKNNGFLVATLWSGMTGNVKCILLIDGYEQICSVLHDIQLLFVFALSKHGYFPPKVSTTSAPVCVTTCLLLQISLSPSNSNNNLCHTWFSLLNIQFLSPRSSICLCTQ